MNYENNISKSWVTVITVIKANFFVLLKSYEMGFVRFLYPGVWTIRERENNVQTHLKIYG